MGRIKGMAHANAGVKAQLFGGFNCFFCGAAFAAFSAERRHIFVFALKHFGQRMIRGDPDKGRAHQCIGAGCVYLDPVMAFGGVNCREGKLEPARLADPVGLHQFDLGGPVVERVQCGKQFFGMVRNLEEPLRQLASLDQCARPPAATGLNLFVGQNRHIDRIPVHHRVLAVNQSFVEEIEEQRLLLAIVFGITGGKFAGPINRQAQRLHLAAHVVDVAVGPILWVSANGHRSVFGRHPECIPTHRVQHIVPCRDLIAGDHIAHGVIADVAHVDAPRGIREHLKHIILRLVSGADRLEHFVFFPGLLPAGFDLGGGISGHRLADLWK